jgi:hypothetical protein
MTPGSTYGKGHIGSGGYFFKSVDGKSRREHLMVAEKALGKPLPPLPGLQAMGRAGRHGLERCRGMASRVQERRSPRLACEASGR